MPANRRRRQRLDVALEQFAAKGFHGTSMRELADAAGITKPVLYQHFGSKQALYAELVGELSAGLEEALVASSLDARTAHERIVTGMRAYLRWAVDQGPAFRMIFAERNGADAEIAAAFASIETMVADLVADLIDAPDLDPLLRQALAVGIVGMAEYAGRQWMLATDGDPVDVDGFADQIASFVWSGLGSVAASPELLDERLARRQAPSGDPA